jgi:hypothetical protein
VNARWIAFGRIEIEGTAYEHDVVVDAGVVSKRKKKPSHPYRQEYGHTPLSLSETIPWGGAMLIVGTGASGRLPIMPEVADEAARRGIELVAAPTPQIMELLRAREPTSVRAILHVTC